MASRGAAAPAAALRDRRLPGRLSHVFGPYRDLVASSSVLTVQSAVMAATGAVFWLLAARHYSAEAVGQAGGLVTLTIVGNYATSLGLPIVIARHATSPDPRAGSIFTASLLLATISSAAAAIVVSLVASEDFAAPLLAHGRLVGGVLFFVAVNGLSFTQIVDNRLIGLGLGTSFLVRHTVVGFARLALVTVALVGPDPLWVWLATTFGALVAIVVALAVQRRSLGPYRIVHVPGWQRVVRFGAANFVSALLAMAPFVILPLIVFAQVDAATNAAFHVAWSIATVAFLVPAIVSRALLIRASEAMDLVVRQARASVLVSLGVALVLLAAALPASLALPWLYGEAYDRSTGYLVVLLFALLPFALTANAISLARIRSETGATLLLSAVLALAVVVPTAVRTPSSGAGGAASSWLVGHIVAGVVSGLYLRSVWRGAVTEPVQPHQQPS